MTRDDERRKAAQAYVIEFAPSTDEFAMLSRAHLAGQLLGEQRGFARAVALLRSDEAKFWGAVESEDFAAWLVSRLEGEG